MKVEISLEKKGRYLSLLLALFAITEPFTHERNDMTVISDDGRYAFRLRTDINYVAFDQVEKIDSPKFWTENLAYGDIQTLYCQFLGAKYDELKKFPWLSLEE